MNRNEREDAAYFAFRDRMKERSFSIEDLDHFTLYVGIHNFARKKFLVDEFEKTMDVTGNIYEFGTWKGAAMMLLAEWYRLRRPQGSKTVYVFDTFEGLGAGIPKDGNAYKVWEGRYASDAEALKELVSAKGLDPFVTFVVGDAVSTTEEHFATIGFPKVSFALLDMDLYEPTKRAIECLLPNLSPNGKILFDEGTVELWEGEQRQLSYLLDCAEKRGMRYRVEENHVTRQPTTVFTRLP